MHERFKIIEENNIYAIAPSSGVPKQIIDKGTAEIRCKKIRKMI